MSLFGHDDFARQSGDLTRRLSALGQELSRLAADRTRSTGDDIGRAGRRVMREARRQTPILARLARHQVSRAGAAVGRDPVPALMAVAGLACLASLALARRKS